jgi:hypothetical protein
LLAQTKLALIDHGHTAISDLPGVSGFAQGRRGQEINAELSEQPKRSPGGSPDQLDMIAHDHAVAIVDRARGASRSATP